MGKTHREKKGQCASDGMTQFNLAFNDSVRLLALRATHARTNCAEPILTLELVPSLAGEDGDVS